MNLNHIPNRPYENIYCVIARNESIGSWIDAHIAYLHALRDGEMVRWSCEMAIKRASRRYFAAQIVDVEG